MLLLLPLLIPPVVQVLTRLPHINTLNVADNRLTDRCVLSLLRSLTLLGYRSACCEELELSLPASE